MMKKLRTPVGLAAAALLFCSAANAQQAGQPQQQYQPPPMPKTKIAILNLQHVVKNYEKWRIFEEEYKSKYKSYDAEFEKKWTEYDPKQANALFNLGIVKWQGKMDIEPVPEPPPPVTRSPPTPAPKKCTRMRGKRVTV